MPKATLVYNLPEELEEYKDAMNGSRYRYALEEVDNRLRSLYKYENKETITIEKARKMIQECIGELDL